MTISYEKNSSVFKGLQPLLSGELILPEDETYDEALQLWSSKVNKHPSALVRCANAQDAIHAIRWARLHGLPLSVRGGGHDFAGRALCDEGVVIDCSQMRAVTINPQARTARIEGGTTVGDLVHSAQQEGLITSVGNISSVGLSGLTLGGGYGPFAGKFGLIADNLLSAQVVTADGNLVTTSASEYPDLFWGLRGGGGNFGVVVSLEYRLYPLGKVLAGLLLYTLDQAIEALHFYNEYLKTAPDELTILSGFLTLPDGPPVLFFSPTYCGSLEEGERVLKPLRTFGRPIADMIQPIAYELHQNSIDYVAPKGRRYAFKTRWIDGLCPEIIDIVVEMAQRFITPFSAIGLHHFHGAASRVAASETPFALRQDHLVVEIAPTWLSPSPEEDQRNMEWAEECAQRLDPYALPGGYINFMGPEEQDRVPLTFGSNYERLREVKRTYDPDDVFNSTSGHITPKSS